MKIGKFQDFMMESRICEQCNSDSHYKLHNYDKELRCSTCGIKYVICNDCYQHTNGKCKICYRNQKIDIITQTN